MDTLGPSSFTPEKIILESSYNFGENQNHGVAQRLPALSRRTRGTSTRVEA